MNEFVMIDHTSSGHYRLTHYPSELTLLQHPFYKLGGHKGQWNEKVHIFFKDLPESMPIVNGGREPIGTVADYEKLVDFIHPFN